MTRGYLFAEYESFGAKHYGIIYQLVTNWILKGKILPHLKDFISDRDYNELDKTILKALAPELERTSVESTVDRFNRAVRNGDLQLEWMGGPHGLTLFKAALIKRGLV